MMASGGTAIEPSAGCVHWYAFGADEDGNVADADSLPPPPPHAVSRHGTKAAAILMMMTGFTVVSLCLTDSISVSRTLVDNYLIDNDVWVNFILLRGETMVELHHLAALIAVADAGGFALAARRLDRSPASVTRSIAAIEKQLGIRLIDRTTRSLRFTESGQGFVDRVRLVLSDLEAAEGEAQGPAAEPHGTVVVTAPSIFGRLLVAPVLCEYALRYRDVRVRADFDDLTKPLAEGGFDVAFRIGDLADSGWNSLLLGHVRRLVVGSPAYFEVRGTPQTPTDLSSHVAVGLARDVAMAHWLFHDSRLGVLREMGEPRIALTVNAGQVAIDAALQGGMLTMALSYQVAEHLQAGRLRRVLTAFEPPPIPVQLLYRGGRQVPAKIRELVRMASGRLKGHPLLAEGQTAQVVAE